MPFEVPIDFWQQWDMRWQRLVVETRMLRSHVVLDTPQARHISMSFVASDRQLINARVIVPTRPGPHPTVLVFADTERFGWFKLSRFVAAGYQVIAPTRRDVLPRLAQYTPSMTLSGIQYIDDALAAVLVARQLPDTYQDALWFYGEGLGAWQALAAGSVVSHIKVTLPHVYAFAPLPTNIAAALDTPKIEGPMAEFSQVERQFDPLASNRIDFLARLSYFDSLAFASGYTGELTLAIPQLDAQLPPGALEELAGCVTGPLTVVRYPKYGHERCNHFWDLVFAGLVESSTTS